MREQGWRDREFTMSANIGMLSKNTSTVPYLRIHSCFNNPGTKEKKAQVLCLFEYVFA